jgi:5-carboxymethyl-2-hydroxymuconic-semialdehyde dehydrogenase
VVICLPTNSAQPVGSTGLSGIGREGGIWSFDFYGDVKNTVYAGQGWSPDG